MRGNSLTSHKGSTRSDLGLEAITDIKSNFGSLNQDSGDNPQMSDIQIWSNDLELPEIQFIPNEGIN